MIVHFFSLLYCNPQTHYAQCAKIEKLKKYYIYKLYCMAKMFTSKEGALHGDPQTVIGESVKVEGTFSGSGDVIVHGEVVGTLKTSNDIMVSASAKIEADVEAHNLTVAGEIHGNVVCHGQLQLQATGKIFGDVTTQVISVEPGAMLKGQCTTDGSGTSQPETSDTNDLD